jgi:putative ABC transport system permease protein
MRMIGTHVRIALASLRATKVRTALTTLGIVIGVASICLVLALGEGAKRAVNEQIGKLGSDIITIRPGKVDRNPQGDIISYNFAAAVGATTLTEHDAKTAKQIAGDLDSAPVMLITGSIRNDGKQANNSFIIATSPAYDEVHKLKMREGQFIEEDLDRYTAVIGNDLAVELYGTDTVLGRVIKLRNQDFTIIGVLKRSPTPSNIGTFFDYNRTVIVSLDAGKSFNQGIAQIQQINVLVPEKGQQAAIAKKLHDKMLKNHGGEEDFAVIRADEAAQISSGLFQVLISVTAAIASISLLVGGVGIMNIMLVSVTERTREIGIRKAVGATNGQVLAQFLIEAVVMSICGGILGLITAYTIAFIVSNFLSFRPALTPEILMIAFGVSLGIGLIFGTFPALKAARKDPIEALRQYQ